MLADVLHTHRLEHLVFGRFELGVPWALDVAANGLFSFYVVSRGACVLSVDTFEQPISLSAGDVVMLPHGPAHRFRDAVGSRAKVVVLDPASGGCQESAAPVVRRLGGDGATTALIAGCFRFGELSTNPLLQSLRAVMHLKASEPDGAAWKATVQVMIAEANAEEMASRIVLGRLADVLLIQALRVRALPSSECKGREGMRAIADPHIGKALRLMHSEPGQPWTVETLASKVGVSRSGFSARFSELVGMPPLHYLARWRMTKAAQLLRETDRSLLTVAGLVGYESGPAFNKAFKRAQGQGPGAYRRGRG